MNDENEPFNYNCGNIEFHKIYKYQNLWSRHKNRSLQRRNLLSLLMAGASVTPITKLWNIITTAAIDQNVRKIIRYFHCCKTLAYQSKLNGHLKLRNFFKREKFDDHSNEKIRKKRWSICIYNWGWVTEIFYLNTHQWPRLTFLSSRNVCETGKNVNREKNIFKVMRDEVEYVWDEVEAYNDLMKLRISTLSFWVHFSKK